MYAVTSTRNPAWNTPRLGPGDAVPSPVCTSAASSCDSRRCSYCAMSVITKLSGSPGAVLTLVSNRIDSFSIRSTRFASSVFASRRKYVS